MGDDGKDKLAKNEKKWGQQIWSVGWTAIPNVILERQKILGLEPLDLNIIAQILKHWWTQDSLPFPSKEALALRIGVTPRTIQRRIAKLKKAGLIEAQERRGPNGGQTSNSYSFDGLIRRAQPYAAEIQNERQQRAANRNARKPGTRSVKE